MKMWKCALAVINHSKFLRVYSFRFTIGKIYPEMTEHMCTMRSGFVDVTRFINECRHKNFMLCKQEKSANNFFSSNFEAGDVCDVRLHKSQLKFPAFGNLTVLSIQIKWLFLNTEKRCVQINNANRCVEVNHKCFRRFEKTTQKIALDVKFLPSLFTWFHNFDEEIYGNSKTWSHYAVKNVRNWMTMNSVSMTENRMKLHDEFDRSRVRFGEESWNSPLGPHDVVAFLDKTW